jgi:hypothetical protein
MSMSYGLIKKSDKEPKNRKKDEKGRQIKKQPMAVRKKVYPRWNVSGGGR